MQLPQLALRSFEFLMTLLITALVGNVIAEAFAGNPSAINFAMFVAVLSWIGVIYGFAASIIDSLAIKVVLLVLDGLNVVFTFVAGVVLAAKLGVHSCGNKVGISSHQKAFHKTHMS